MEHRKKFVKNRPRVASSKLKKREQRVGGKASRD